MADEQRKFFIITRSLTMEDENYQLLQFVVPGFNLVKTVKVASDEMSNQVIDDELSKFQLEASGYVTDWQNALNSKDEKIQEQYPAKQIWDTCWFVNEAVESAIDTVADGEKKERNLTVGDFLEQVHKPADDKK